MWHNLLSHAAFAPLQRERKIRLATAVARVVALAAAIGVGALLPSVVQVAMERETSQMRLQQGSEREALTEAQKVLQQARRFVNAVGRVRLGKVAGKLLADLLALSSASVQLKGVTITPVKKEGWYLSGSLTGVAASREALRSFEEQVRSYDGMEEVVVPLEAYAPRTDLRFSLRFRYRLPSSPDAS